jgi:hypothetical protein
MRARRLAAGVAASVLLLSAAGAAQELWISAGAGGFFAARTAYQRVYGSSLALAGGVWLKLKGPFGLATGFDRIADSGTAVPLAGGEEEYPVRFHRTTIPIVAFFGIDGKTIGLRLGVGAGIHSYRETWQTVDLDYKGSKVSVRIVLAGSIALLDRLSVFCSAAYDPLLTGVGSPLASDVNLGGFELIGGLSYRIF